MNKRPFWKIVIESIRRKVDSLLQPRMDEDIRITVRSDIIQEAQLLEHAVISDPEERRQAAEALRQLMPSIQSEEGSANLCIFIERVAREIEAHREWYDNVLDLVAVNIQGAPSPLGPSCAVMPIANILRHSVIPFSARGHISSRLRGIVAVVGEDGCDHLVHERLLELADLIEG